MRVPSHATDLRLDELFTFDGAGGRMHFAGERVVLMDAVALGLLRKQLITAFGMTGARALLTRFGYGHGWRLAESMKDAIPWADEREWRVAGGRLHRLHGMVTFEPVAPSEAASPPAFAESVWRDSFEAEQHLVHHGQADTCVCWMLVGFASGYLSRVNGRTVYCLETACRGRGDAVCRMVGRPKEEWPEAVQSELAFYESDCLNETLKHLQTELKKVDRRLQQRTREMKRLAGDDSGLVLRSEAMQLVVGQARRVAAVDSTVLLLGESGSGKERLARLIHETSGRQGGPFVAINCAAMPEALLEAELFGHAKGAFTGAVAERAGLFESAQGGTLLLDEVGELPPAMQATLLRVLQEREVRRVGENRTRSIDVRVVSATHRDLQAEVRAGRFREDLYFRLRVVELRVPPLRARADDIVPLARAALADTCTRLKLPQKSLSAGVARALVAYAWPGNVRELFNAMERAAVLSEHAELEVSDLPVELQHPVSTVGGAGRRLEDIEREAILTALADEGGNRSRTATRLGIGQATLFRKLKQYQRDGHEVAQAA
ncbi:MAG: sigma-54-dependent Fis family transcriptional regulator [Archangium sp.]|nr:sigma-54-dependent Fis family transcriptional regulator [Archangium sp.]